MSTSLKTTTSSKTPLPTVYQFPLKGLVKLEEIVSCKKKGSRGFLPVSRTKFLQGVKDGIYPQPVKLNKLDRSVFWYAEEIHAYVDGLRGNDTASNAETYHTQKRKPSLKVIQQQAIDF